MRRGALAWSRNALVIVNPAAGGGRCGRKAAPALAALREAGLQLEVRETSAAKEATAIAAEAHREGVRTFIAAGGDGTAFEVLNGLLPAALSTDARITLGILPLGTGNSFVRDFSKHGTAYCLQALSAGRHRPTDILLATHSSESIFVLGGVSLGFAAEVAALVNRRFKPLGKLGYTLGVLAKLIALSTRDITLGWDGEVPARAPTSLLTIGNNRYIGGNMQMTPGALIDDGVAELLIAGPVGRLDLLRTFPKIFKGTHVHHPAVEIHRVRSVDFDFDEPVDVMIDGESLCIKLDRVEVIPKAIEVAL